MTRAEVVILLGYMSEVWTNAREASVRTVDTWTDLLGDMPFPVAQRAVRKLAMTWGPFAPIPADIRRAAREIRDPLAIEAHAQSIKAIGTLYVFSDGWQCEGLKEMHPLARRALELFGVIEFANANPEFARPQYMKIYEQLVKRAEEEALLPGGFKEEIEVLRGGHAALPSPNTEKAKEMIEALAKEKGMP